MTENQSKMSMERTLHELAKFQFILSEGKKGNHLLFSPQAIRDAFQREQDELRHLFQDKIDEINETLNQTFTYSSFEEKRDFLHSLPIDIQHAMIFGYFQLIESEVEDAERIVN